jgi:hypothetical protein
MQRTINSPLAAKSITSIILDQVMEKQNYDLKVHCKICFVECDPGEPGYDMGVCTFIPWGADAFQVMQGFIENTVDPNYIHLDITIENLQDPVKEVEFYKRRPVTEDNVRGFFNLTFSYLDKARSAGAIYVGDNGAYILDYLDVTQEECDKLREQWLEAFGPNCSYSHKYQERSFQIHIC